MSDIVTVQLPAYSEANQTYPQLPLTETELQAAAAPEIPCNEKEGPHLHSQALVGRTPCNIFCDICKKNVTTVVQYKTGLTTFLGCSLIAVFGCVFGCCLIPFCVDAAKDAEHYCPICNTLVGISKKI